MTTELHLYALKKFPQIKKNDDVAKIILEIANQNQWKWKDRDIVIIAQKIVSKAEGREVPLSSISPSSRAIRYAASTEKDPRIVELILNESEKILRTRKGLIIVEHKLGFICANAGIDQSNVDQKNDRDQSVLLLPQNPDKSAASIRKKIIDATGKTLGVMIIDSHGRPWRKGVVGVSIGLSGVDSVVDRRGYPDLYGHLLRVTEIGACDELAAAGSLMMGQGNEGRPVVIARGFPYEMREDATIKDVIRPQTEDLFR